MLLLTPMARIKHSDGVTTFSFFWTFAFFYGYHPHTSPLRFSFGTPVFDSSVRFSVEKAGLILAFVAQMMDGRPHGRKIGLEHSA
jgi:hypothetical protein